VTLTSPDGRLRLQPLLKWAGGKRQLLPALREHYPHDYDRYIEPFLGSGAVFFDLYSSGRLTGRVVRLVDLNADLVGCYVMLRDETEAVIRALELLKHEHEAHGDACYYDVRDRRFNPLRSTGPAAYTPELAAMLIYLNRTGFNGLFRLNRRGDFNVPAGRYENPRILDADHLRAVARAFQAEGVSIECAPFEQTLADAGVGDFVYCDPPYVALSRTASFAHYTAGGFSAADHHRLQQAVIAAARRGAAVVVSNSSAEVAATAYSCRSAREAGLNVSRVPARRLINSNASRRGPVQELIVSNTRDPIQAGAPKDSQLPVMGQGKLRMARREADLVTKARRKTG
jgi:DNA adenine methylase